MKKCAFIQNMLYIVLLVLIIGFIKSYRKVTISCPSGTCAIPKITNQETPPHKNSLRDALTQTESLSENPIKEALVARIASQSSTEAPKTVVPLKINHSAKSSLPELHTTLAHLAHSVQATHLKIQRDETLDDHEKNILLARTRELTSQIEHIDHYIQKGAPTDEIAVGSEQRNTYKVYKKTATRKVMALKIKVEELLREISE